MSDSLAERSRPRDRKRRIEEAAALAFAERGYHQVGMIDVANAVGISAPALYRHFPNKYALFAHTAFLLAHRLVEATAFADDAQEPASDPRARITKLLDAVIDTTIELRAVGGIYRWEGRYLERDDRARLTAEFDTLRQRFLDAHALLHPEHTPDERETLVWAALAAIASITAHHTASAASALREVLRAAAWRALDAAPAAAQPSVSAPEHSPHDGEKRRDRLVREAILLFAARGYHEVTIEQIAAAAGLTASGVYRHFDGKSALLLRACAQAAEELEAGMQRARAGAASPEETARLLANDYVRHSIENRQLMRVYAADVGSLSADEQRTLRVLQRAYLTGWVEVLRAVKPLLSEREATVLVHAAFSVVADLGTLAAVRHQDLATQTQHLVCEVLGL